MKKKINIPALIFAMMVPLLLGIVSSILTSDAMKQFHFFNKPPLSPPGWLFPIVWTILYLMMGIASYIVVFSNAEASLKRNGIIFYSLQLIFNFVWSLIFFNASDFLFAFIWLIVMWILVIITTIFFAKANLKAGLLMLPYIAWTTFAGYLNLGIYILSRTPAIMHK